LAKKLPQKTSRNSKPKKRPIPSGKRSSGAAILHSKLKKAAPASAAPKVAVAARTKPAQRRTAKASGTNRPGRVKGTAQRLTPEGFGPGSPGSASRVETFLTREEVQQFRHMLLEKRAEILGDVSTLHNEALDKDRRDAAGDLSSMPIHMADLGSDNYELEFTLGLIEGERVILREIDEALERIRQGTYGVCLATGKPIGKARLKAKPWAKYCYEYTLAQEQGQARRF
jgi:DnaK suppressor protein